MRQADGRPVVIKMPDMAHVDPRGIARLERESGLIRKCQGSPHVVEALELLRLPGTAALVLEDFQGHSLNRLLSGPLEIRAFLRRANSGVPRRSS